MHLIQAALWLLPALVLPTYALPPGDPFPLDDAFPPSGAYNQPVEVLAPPHGPTCPSCNPDPRLNRCDQTTSCVYVPGAHGAHFYCACRHGYRADRTSPSDSSAQFQLPWKGQEGRVFVRPGLSCNTLCDHSELGPKSCQEVSMKPVCF